MPNYALMSNADIAVAPKGLPKNLRHSECGGTIEPVGTEGKWICSECAKVGFPLKSHIA